MRCLFASLLKCTLEMYWILLIDVTIKKKKTLRADLGQRWTPTAGARTSAELCRGYTS